SSIDNLKIRTLSNSSVGDTGGVMSYSNGQDNVFINLSKGGKNASVSDSLSVSGSTTITVSYLAQGTNGSGSLATTNITVGAGTTYHNTAQGLIDAVNNSGLGLSASFSTAAQAGTVAANSAAAANVPGGSGADTGIEISGTGVGTGTNGAGEIGTLTVGAPGDALGGTLTIVGMDGKSHNITLGAPNSTDTLKNLAATINAAGYGVTASPNTGIVGGNAVGTVLTFTSTSGAVTISGASLTDNSAATALTGTPTLDTAYDATIGTLTATVPTGNLGGTLTIGNNTILLGTPSTTKTMAELLSTINSGNYGVSATYNATTGVMTLTSPNSAITLGGALLTDSGGGTLTATEATADHNQIGTVTVGGAGWGDTNVMTGTTFTFGTQTINIPAATTYGAMVGIINGANLGVTASEDASGNLTFVSNNPATEGVAFSANMADGTVGVTFAVARDTPSASNSEYYSVGITGSITDNSTGGGTLNTGMVVDTDGNGGIATMSYADGAGADLSTTDLITQAHAQAALEELNIAITDVAALDGYIGAQINTLNSISQVMSTQQENIVSAQNAIQATDYASATSNMSKYEILSQTGIAALAQANSVQQEVTKLLQ
ncbi:MAG: flagellin, partial [Terracidiphilus sp.]